MAVVILSLRIRPSLVHDDRGTNITLWHCVWNTCHFGVFDVSFTLLCHGITTDDVQLVIELLFIVIAGLCIHF